MGSIHAFSIELKSKEFVKNLSIPDEGGKVVIEDVMLEIEGDFGSFFLDFDENEIARIIPKMMLSGA